MKEIFFIGAAFSIVLGTGCSEIGCDEMMQTHIRMPGWPLLIMPQLLRHLQTSHSRPSVLHSKLALKIARYLR